MLRRDIIKGAAVAAALSVEPSVRAALVPARSGTFADVNGHQMFYDSIGAGKPLIVLHGGINPDSYGDNLAMLAAQRRVIAVHLQGHGHTPDTKRPLSAEALGDDTAVLIQQLGLLRADVMGYSLGAGVALQTAIRHPDRVDRLVLVSGMMRRDGAYPEEVAAFDQLEANAATFGPGVKASPLGQAYPDVDWTRLFRKVGQMTKRPYDLSAAVAKVIARTLLVFADADMMRPEHMVEFWKAMGGGQRDAGLNGTQRSQNQLAIIPGATHYSIPVDPLLVHIVDRFLRSG